MHVESTVRMTLATDLDGTLIPLSDDPANLQALDTIRRWHDSGRLETVFVTGRHLELVEEAIQQHHLPTPDWIIADVGSSIYRRTKTMQADEPSTNYASFERLDDYYSELGGDESSHQLDKIRQSLAVRSGVRLQEGEKQTALKASFYIEAERVAAIAEEVRQEFSANRQAWTVIDSVDPFTGNGLLDILPSNASKADALHWWVKHLDRPSEQVVFAGDSGNDWAAFISGYQTVVVGNADRQLARRVYDHHHQRNQTELVYLSKGRATTGVVEALRWFGFPGQDDDGTDVAETYSASDLPYGVTPLISQRSFVRFWAPKVERLTVCNLTNWSGPLFEYSSDEDADLSSQRWTLSRSVEGFHTGTIELGPGDRYCFELDNGQLRPDPLSRRQPFGVHGVSEIVNPHGFPWQDESWKGIPKRDLIFYELHVGTFTEAGTYAAIETKLDQLKQLGITAIELMPVAESPGRWNWGYDGTYLFGVENEYGTPDELRALIDACHQRGLAVILDVVYNHLGPEGNYLAEFGSYFSSKHKTPWGETFSFDGRHRDVVRELIRQNVRYWIEEFHFDGLRLDAAHFMFDDSPRHILHDISDDFRKLEKKLERQIHLIAEANVYDPVILGDQPPGPARSDAIWCDDLLHAAQQTVAPHELFAHREYFGAEDLLRTLRDGYVYHGTSAGEYLRVDVDPSEQIRPGDFQSLIVALQNHDKVGNHPHGMRIHQISSIEAQLALAPLALLNPSLPLIFMGEEMADDAPFRFFSDFEDQRIRNAVDRGRRREYPHGSWDDALSPSDERAFYSSKLSRPLTEASRVFRWYHRLIQLRKDWLVEELLSSENLQVEANEQRDCFSLHYRATDSEGSNRNEKPPAFILVYLPNAKSLAKATPSALELTGEVDWFLDSRSEHLSKLSAPQLELLQFDHQPTALVGRGTLDWKYSN